MSTTPTIEPEHWDDAALGEEPTGPRCSNCGGAQAAELTVCRRCGYYAPLGRVVELDPSDREGGAPVVAPPSFWQVWSGLVPLWGWAVACCVVLVVAESVLVANLVPAGKWRTLWSFSQLLIGFCALMTVHGMAYLALLMENAGANLLDIIIKPLACWSPVVKRLPKGWWRIALGAGSLTAMLMSLLVIRGLDYEKLLDWGIKEQPKHNLLGAVVEQTKKIAPKDETLEEALNSLENPIEEPEKEPEKLKVAVDCVILGYTSRKERPEEFTALILASEVAGQLKIVGLVAGGIAPETQTQLQHRFVSLKRPDPFVEYTLPGATWLEPRVTCRVKCLKQHSDGTLEEPEFESLLGELRLP